MGKWGDFGQITITPPEGLFNCDTSNKQFVTTYTVVSLCVPIYD